MGCNARRSWWLLMFTFLLSLSSCPLHTSLLRLVNLAAKSITAPAAPALPALPPKLVNYNCGPFGGHCSKVTCSTYLDNAYKCDAMSAKLGGVPAGAGVSS